MTGILVLRLLPFPIPNLNEIIYEYYDFFPMAHRMIRWYTRSVFKQEFSELKTLAQKHQQELESLVAEQYSTALRKRELQAIRIARFSWLQIPKFGSQSLDEQRSIAAFAHKIRMSVQNIDPFFVIQNEYSAWLGCPEKCWTEWLQHPSVYDVTPSFFHNFRCACEQEGCNFYCRVLDNKPRGVY